MAGAKDVKQSYAISQPPDIEHTIYHTSTIPIPIFSSILSPTAVSSTLYNPNVTPTPVPQHTTRPQKPQSPAHPKSPHSESVVAEVTTAQPAQSTTAAATESPSTSTVPTHPTPFHRLQATSTTNIPANSTPISTPPPVKAARFRRWSDRTFRGRGPCGGWGRRGERCGSRVLRVGLRSFGRGFGFCRHLWRLVRRRDHLSGGRVQCEIFVVVKLFR
jgi:hypothetical protein